MTTSPKTIAAMEDFISSAIRLHAAFENDSFSSGVKKYPLYLPSFYGFVQDLIEWRAANTTEPQGGELASHINTYLPGQS